MKNLSGKAKVGRWFLALLLVVLCCFTVAPFSAPPELQGAVTVTNSSSREIDHLYTSPPDRQDWSADQLPEGTKLQTGESFVLNNFISENGQIKVIAEDKEGCFLYAVISCQEPATWIITNTTPRDCGS
jgi:hypothetical protein